MTIEETTRQIINKDHLINEALAISESLTGQDWYSTVVNLFSTSAGSRASQVFQLGYLMHRWGLLDNYDIDNVYSIENIQLAYEIIIQNTMKLPIELKENIGKIMANTHKDSTFGYRQYNNKELDYSDYIPDLIESMRKFSNEYDEKSKKVFLTKTENGRGMLLSKYLEINQKDLGDLFHFIDNKLTSKPAEYIAIMRALSTGFGNYPWLGSFIRTSMYTQASNLWNTISKEFINPNSNQDN